MKANILSFLQNKITSPKGSNLHTIKFNNMSKFHNKKKKNKNKTKLLHGIQVPYKKL